MKSCPTYSTPQPGSPAAELGAARAYAKCGLHELATEHFGAAIAGYEEIGRSENGVATNSRSQIDETIAQAQVELAQELFSKQLPLPQTKRDWTDFLDVVGKAKSQPASDDSDTAAKVRLLEINHLLAS